MLINLCEIHRSEQQCERYADWYVVLLRGTNMISHNDTKYFYFIFHLFSLLVIMVP